MIILTETNPGPMTRLQPFDLVGGEVEQSSISQSDSSILMLCLD